MFMKITYIFLIPLVGVFILFVSIVSAANYTFTWDKPHKNDNVAAYEIYYRMNYGMYDIDNNFESFIITDKNKFTNKKFDIDNPSWKIELPNLAEEYCFFAIAIDDDGLPSAPSDEVGWGESCGKIGYPGIREDADGDEGGDGGGGGGGGGCYIWVTGSE